MKDYATSLIISAPSPATSGTSLIVQSGHGDRFPDPPFYASVHPALYLPDLDNAEKVRVTAKVGDTFTIERALSPTTAKSIQVGYRISNTLFVDDIADLNTVDSVNGQIGTVVLDTDDVSDSGATNKYVTAAEKTKLSNLSGTNTGDQDLSGLVPNTRTVNGHALSSNVTVTKGDVGLGNADNTSDANKPVSTATQTALDALSSAGDNYVPYTGATTNVDLGTNDITTRGQMYADNFYGAPDGGVETETYFSVHPSVVGGRTVIQANDGDDMSTPGGDILLRYGNDSITPGRVRFENSANEGISFNTDSVTSIRNVLMPDYDIDLSYVNDITNKADSVDVNRLYGYMGTIAGQENIKDTFLRQELRINPNLYTGPTGIRCVIPTHDPANIDGEITHPSVVYTPEGWNGYKYWMGVTPYLNSNDSYEDPNIVASNDGINWEVPPGLTNPLDDAPGGSQYNSDTHLVFGPNNVLYLFWRYLDTSGGAPGAEENIFMRTSTDGITWTPKQLVHQTDQTVRRLLSPSFEYYNGVWHMFAVDIVGTKRVVYTTSPDLTPGSWSTPLDCTVSLPSGRYPWHLFVARVGEQWVGLLNDSSNAGNSGQNGDLILMTSELSDGLTWDVASHPVVPRAGSTFTRQYRSCFVAKVVDGMWGFDLWHSVWNPKYVYRTSLTTVDYKPESSMQLGKLGLGGAAVTRPLRIYATAPEMEFVESDNSDKTWHMGLNAGIWKVTETGVQDKLLLQSANQAYGMRYNDTNTKSSGNYEALLINPNITHTGTASYTGLYVNVTETSTGSGTNLLLRAGVGGVSKFTVDNTGVTTATSFSGSGAGLTSIPQSAITSLTTDLTARVLKSGDTMTGALINTLASGNSLIWDTNSLVVDATNHRVGVGTASPNIKFHVVNGGVSSALSATPSTRGMAITGTDGTTRLYFESTTATSGRRVFVINNEAGQLNISSLNDSGSAFTSTNVLSVGYNGLIGINTAAPTHTLTFASTGTGIAIYNTADQTTNYERGTLAYASNQFELRTGGAGTGQGRDIFMQVSSATNFRIRFAQSTTQGSFTLNRDLSTANAIHTHLNGTHTQSSGSVTHLNVQPSITQTSTAGYTALSVNAIENSLGSGTKLLADFKVGGTSRFRVDNTGRLYMASTTAPGSPADGDIWFDGTDLKMQIGGVTKTFTLT